MSKLAAALSLAAQGFRVFPLVEGSKLPLIDGWERRASCDPERVRAWWVDPVLGVEQDYNIGIATEFYGDGALIVVDVDNKGNKRGDETILGLELSGNDLPPTLEAATPTGGRHLFYRTPHACKQGAGVLGVGVDIRSRGGFVVGAGSSVEAGSYRWIGEGVPHEAPAWLVSRLGRSEDRSPRPASVPTTDVPEDRATQRAIFYLSNEAPVSVEGEGGDSKAYLVAARVKDMGVKEDAAVDLMLAHWNERCSPPWSADELASKVANAYRYGKETPGVAAPETQFEPLVEDQGDVSVHPLEKMNREFALVYVGSGTNILWETNDVEGATQVRHINKHSFLDLYANQPFNNGKKIQTIAQAWMEWPGRRTYPGGVEFLPEKDLPPKFFNLWRGFAYDAADTADHPSVRMWVEHLRENVCQGNASLADWLLGYFAHLIQRPWEKPLTALVFRGSKGVGKNAVVERVAALLGRHAKVVADRRYLVGNFNSHLENCLMFVMDEAFWSGDKQADGIIKHLVTGKEHVIERKGAEPYSVRNITRPVVLGNEDWLVPASHDERRFAVFDVGDGRKQDRSFFESMRLGMEQGGYRHLLRYLRQHPVGDVNAAPATKALADQKLNSMSPFQAWWYQCLQEGSIGSTGSSWPEKIEVKRLRDVYYAYCKDRNISGWRPEDHKLRGWLREVAPSIPNAANHRIDGASLYSYVLPSLEQARAEFAAFMQTELKWE